MSLREYKTTEELRQLQQKLVGGPGPQLPSDNVLDNALSIAISGDYTCSTFEVLGYPEEDPQYIALVEFSDIQFPYIALRRPAAGHNLELLDEMVTLVIKRLAGRLLKESRALITGDAETCDAFERNFPAVLGAKFSCEVPTKTATFYMTAEQREKLLKSEIEAPTGFTLDPVDVDRDGPLIHQLWGHGISEEITKNRLRHLPSICARDEKGIVAGWAMAARFGQISNLFVLPEFRRRGVGNSLEFWIAREFALRGLRVFKFVEVANKPVYEGSLRCPLWSLVRDEEGRTIHYYFKMMKRED